MQQQLYNTKKEGKQEKDIYLTTRQFELYTLCPGAGTSNHSGRKPVFVVLREAMRISVGFLVESDLLHLMRYKNMRKGMPAGNMQIIGTFDV